MVAQLNHTIVWSSDQMKSATFLAEMLGRPAPTRVAHFDVVELDNGVSLDFANADGPIRPQHYAFLISEADFDAVLGRIRERGLDHWVDPMRRRPGEINHNVEIRLADQEGIVLWSDRAVRRWRIRVRRRCRVPPSTADDWVMSLPGANCN